MKQRLVIALSFLSMLVLFISCQTVNTNRLPLWESNNTRNKTIVISDLHLGIDDSYTETLENRAYLVEFLQRLQSTKDVKELVIAGDFLDAWYLPVFYPSYTDENEFYKGVIANNKEVIAELNKVIKSGIALIYVPGNHDLTLEANVLKEAIPSIQIVSDEQGLGTYYTGNNKEIVIEHGHRYDIFSAPDKITNEELCGNKNNTILPAGYIYARYAATWVIEGRPAVAKDLPVITQVPDKTNIDQFSAYIYYSVLKQVSTRMTPKEDLNEKIFKLHIAGFDDDYSYLDFYPVTQADGTISANKLFKNIQRTWQDRQIQNNVKVSNSFIQAVAGANNWDYYFDQAKIQYLENPNEKVDIVIFGHTHVPSYYTTEEGKLYVNSGTWVDHNTDFPEATRTFVVVESGKKDLAEIYSYLEDGTLQDLKPIVSK